ncbi:MAG: PEGA domain-containing protein, partial [Methanosarcinales archaeon]|nr:PEGA domain-containing protein [Candidatus Ethanoperedens thermophilum]
MTVTQYSTDVGAHAMHEDKLDCTACHTGWQLTCTNCHLDTRKGTQFVTDEFRLGVGSDGKIRPFMKMETMYNNATHTGYGEWFSHTVTDKAKDCAFCHENPEVFCEGCEGEILGEGGSFISQEKIDHLTEIFAAPPKTEAPATPEMPSGRISVSSTPSGASIYLNDIYKGTTPKTLTGVPVGSHTIILEKSG